MKERTILFPGAMVRAILAGQKTQMRRVIKIPAIKPGLELLDLVKHGDKWLMKVKDENLFVAHLGDENLRIKCPFGASGDHLWVRETFHHEPAEYDTTLSCSHPFYLEVLAYRASTPENEWHMHLWRPSIHMPRWVSHITLEVTGVRVERLQDISEYDARTEGIKIEGCEFSLDEPCRHCKPCPSNIIAQFKTLWESVYAKRPGCSWKDNPWVWCVDFKRIQQNNNCM